MQQQPIKSVDEVLDEVKKFLMRDYFNPDSTLKEDEIKVIKFHCGRHDFRMIGSEKYLGYIFYTIKESEKWTKNSEKVTTTTDQEIFIPLKLIKDVK